MKKLKIAVVGGGAAGMLAALTASGQGADVTIWEKNDRVGKKILATGNGKCNFSNRDMGIEHYYGSDLQKAKKVLEQFGVQETEEFFETLGMLIKERDGYLYPASEQASTVLDLLRMQIQRQGIKVVTEAKVREVKKASKGGFEVTAETGNGKVTTGFDKVILTCGGCASPKTGSDGDGFRLAEKLGHTVIPAVPALVQLRCGEKDLKAVAGVRARALVKLMIDGREVAEETGELQITDYGISGIVVFQISRIAAYALKAHKKVTAKMNLLPDFTEQAYEQFKKERLQHFADRSAEEFFTGMLNKKLMMYFMKQAKIKPDMPIKQADKAAVNRVFALCREWVLHIENTNSFDNAQVSAGGVSFVEVTDKLESAKVPGLYFAGEILDIDGKCGGYNLQWAWSSGYTAGKSAAE